MKALIKKLFRKIYFAAFPAGIPTNRDIVHECIIGENSKIYDQASICNPSKSKERIVIGNNTHVAGYLTVWGNAGHIEIGNCSFIGEGTRIYSVRNVRIGDRVQIAHNCNIFDSNIHSLDPVERNKEYIQNISGGPYQRYDLKGRDVVIKDDAWIGASAIILKGVVIGRCAIIGAGSVVTGDIPDYSVAVGNPARVVKHLSI